MILIPVKNLAHSKQRLAGVLSQNVRTKLAKAMLLDILEVLSAWQKRPEVSIVTGDPFAIEVAKHFNFRVIQDSENTGETDAIAMATHICESQGAENTLVIPGDIPLIEVLELEKIVHSAPRAVARILEQLPVVRLRLWPSVYARTNCGSSTDEKSRLHSLTLFRNVPEGSGRAVRG